MLRIVIIDDEFFFRNALKSNMPWSDNGMVVVGDANDGPSGLDLILSEQPDIAIVDINMPVYNGLALIAKAREAGVECVFIVLTGYDEFKYAQSAVSLGVSSYVLKPVDFGELMEILLREKQKLSSRRRQKHAVDELERQANRLRLDRSFSGLVNFQLSQTESTSLRRFLGGFERYCVALFAPRDANQPSNPDQLREELLSAGLDARYQIFLDPKTRLALLADVFSVGQMRQLIADLRLRVPALNDRFEIGMGRVYREFGQIYLSYNEACIDIRNHLIYAGPLSEAGEGASAMPVCERRKNLLRSAVTALDADGACAILREIYQSLYDRHAQFDMLVLNTLDLMALLIALLSQRGADTVSILGDEMGILDRLERFRSVWAFCDWTSGLYREGIRRLSVLKSGLSEVSSQVIGYVLSHLAQSDLTIQHISDALFLNYSYLCVTFKHDTGMTINDFIVRERMNAAKAMFDAGAVSVSRVSREVGYEDAGYFSKCFRKLQGVSPSEYIRALGAGHP